MGRADGCGVGTGDGCGVGTLDGCNEGRGVGCSVGTTLGCGDGTGDGCGVGTWCEGVNERAGSEIGEEENRVAYKLKSLSFGRAILDCFALNTHRRWLWGRDRARLQRRKRGRLKRRDLGIQKKGGESVRFRDIDMDTSHHQISTELETPSHTQNCAWVRQN